MSQKIRTEKFKACSKLLSVSNYSDRTVLQTKRDIEKFYSFRILLLICLQTVKPNDIYTNWIADAYGRKLKIWGRRVAPSTILVSGP